MENRYNLFTTLISKIYKNIIKIKISEMSVKGLKAIHVSCLYYLYINNGQLTFKELVDFCYEDKGALSRAINFLLENNYVECNFNGKKAYKNPIILTEYGKEEGKYITEKINDILTQVSISINDEQRENLYKTLETIANKLQLLSDNYTK